LLRKFGILLTSKRLKEIVLGFLETSREGKTNVKHTGIKLQALEAKGEASIKRVVDRYLADFCQAAVNSKDAIAMAKRQCDHLMKFFTQKRNINC
jgi:hypothetical protein